MMIGRRGRSVLPPGHRGAEEARRGTGQNAQAGVDKASSLKRSFYSLLNWCVFTLSRVIPSNRGCLCDLSTQIKELRAHYVDVVWELDDPPVESVQQLRIPQCSINAVALTADADLLLVGDSDGTVRVFRKKVRNLAQPPQK